jgi:hypothetical protein
VVDLKGKNHRYILMWMGPKLDSGEISKTSNCMLELTGFATGSDITMTRVRRGHEEESLLSLFPSGFITF